MWFIVFIGLFESTIEKLLIRSKECSLRTVIGLYVKTFSLNWECYHTCREASGWSYLEKLRSSPRVICNL